MSTSIEDRSRPTVVLVHGAFAESASWDGVIRQLQERGYTAIAAANPLRSLSGDAGFVASILDSIEGPIVLVGHSYGGSVISNAALDKENVEALVFVAAFAPEERESIGELSGRFPGSTLAETLATVPLPDGTTDLYIRQEEYQGQFAADVPAEQATLMAATQRPLRDVALNEGSGPPAWRDLPSWFVIPGLDKNVPPEAQRFMADRAGAREVLEIEGASHAVPASRAEEVAGVIFAATAHVEQLAQNPKRTLTRTDPAGTRAVGEKGDTARRSRGPAGEIAGDRRGEEVAEVELTAGALTVRVKGMDKLWALKSRLEVPLDHVADAAVAGEAGPPLLGLRAPGTHVPGVFAAGTFYYEGKRVFWDVHDPSKAVLIRLHDERYDELVVEVEDPAATAAEIERVIGDREDH